MINRQLHTLSGFIISCMSTRFLKISVSNIKLLERYKHLKIDKIFVGNKLSNFNIQAGRELCSEINIMPIEIENCIKQNKIDIIHADDPLNNNTLLNVKSIDFIKDKYEYKAEIWIILDYLLCIYRYK